ncbi:hypothetical protein CRE_22727, partial [Caenorhabditis remanei]
QKRRQPKSDSESEKSLKNPRPKLIQPSPVVSVPKTSSPDRTKQKSTVQDMVKGVVNRITFTPNRKQQKSTSTPPTSEIRKVSDVRSDYVDSELEKQAKKSKSKGSISTSLSGSTESMISDFTKKPIQNKQIVSVPSKAIKTGQNAVAAAQAQAQAQYGALAAAAAANSAQAGQQQYADYAGVDLTSQQSAHGGYYVRRWA